MTPIKTHMGGIEWTMLILISICWGSSFYFNRIAVLEVPVLTIVLGRIGIGAILIYLFARARGLHLPRTREAWRELAVLSVLQYSLPLILIVWSQKHIPSGLASILNATMPIWAAIAAHLMMPDERLSLPRIVGVLFGVVGVAVMIGPQMLAGPHDHLWPELASLVAAICFGISAVYSRRLGRLGVAPSMTASGSMMLGTATLLPLVLVIDKPANWIAEPGLQAWGAVLALGLLAGALAFILFFDLIRRAGALNASLATILNPLTAILLGLWLLNETLAPRHYLGIVLIALGFAILDGRALRALRGKRASA